MEAKLKLKHTREADAVKGLLLIADGVSYQPISRRLGGSSVGVK